uniref:Uncharacterized protein n=1 Tax=Arundo donax TaxID=35708 RepID=A0A0A9CA71_ARUDO
MIRWMVMTGDRGNLTQVTLTRYK